MAEPMTLAEFAVKVKAEGVEKANDVLRLYKDYTAKAAEETKKLEQANKDAEKATQSHTAALRQIVFDLAKVAGAFITVREAVRFITDSTQLAARYETLGVSMRVVAENIGKTGSEAQKAADGLVEYGISMRESRQAVLSMMNAQLDLAKSQELARVAQGAAVIANEDSSTTFQRLIYAIQSGNVLMLRHIGINANFEQAYQRTAQSLGITTTRLTEAERTAARMEEVLKRGAVTTGVYEAAFNTAGKQVLSMQRYIEDFQLLLGKVGLDAYTELVFGLSRSIVGLNKDLKDLERDGTLKKWSEAVTDSVTTVLDKIQDVSRFFRAMNLEIATWSAKLQANFEAKQQRSWWQRFGGALGFDTETDAQRVAREGVLRSIDEQYNKGILGIFGSQNPYVSAIVQASREEKRQREGLEALLGSEFHFGRGAARTTETRPTDNAAIRRRDLFETRLRSELEALQHGGEQGAYGQFLKLSAQLDEIDKKAPGAKSKLQPLIDEILRLKSVADDTKAYALAWEQVDKALTAAQASVTKFYVANKEGERTAAFQQGILYTGGRYSTREQQLYALRQRYEATVAALPDDNDNPNIQRNNAEQMVRAQKEMERAAAALRDRWREADAAMSDWENGFNKAFADYIEMTRDVATATEQAFSRGFKAAEDALTQFVTTGKLNFKSLVEYVIQEYARINIVRPLIGALGGLSFGGSAYGSAADVTSTVLGLAGGGSMFPGGTYMVGEAGREYVTGSGTVQPANDAAPQVTINMNVRAIDAKDVTQVMIGQRDTILGIVRQAWNSRGKTTPYG